MWQVIFFGALHHNHLLSQGFLIWTSPHERVCWERGGPKYLASEDVLQLVDLLFMEQL